VSDYHLFPVLKQIRDDYGSKHDCEMAAVETTTPNTDIYQQGTEKTVINALLVAETMWKRCETAVQLSLNCCYYGCE
jgi:hypothetical protein